MGVERYGSKTDVVVKLVLVFFIALLSFSIGTFVGKKFSDNQHKLAQLEPTEHETVAEGDGHDRDVASVDHAQAEAKPNEALSDEDIAKLAEEFVADDEDGGSEQGEAKLNDHAAPADTHKSASHDNEDAHAAPRKVASAPPSHEAERVAQGHTPTAQEKKSAAKAIPSSLPGTISSSAIGKFTVQVASFAEENEAFKRVAELTEQGFSAFKVGAVIKGKTWYRVNVGLFATQKEAAAYKDDLVSRAKVTSAIIQKISSLQ